MRARVRESLKRAADRISAWLSDETEPKTQSAPIENQTDTDPKLPSNKPIEKPTPLATWSVKNTQTSQTRVIGMLRAANAKSPNVTAKLFSAAPLANKSDLLNVEPAAQESVEESQATVSIKSKPAASSK